MSGIRLGQTATTSFSRGELQRIDIQALIRQGLPKLEIVGLPQNVIREGSGRILSALHLLGFSLRNQKILVSLNPADLKKEGSHFDLPILVAILRALQLLNQPPETDFFWGELNLDGSLRPFTSFLAHLLFVQDENPQNLRAPFPADEIEFLEPYLHRKAHEIHHIHELLEESHPPKKTIIKPTLTLSQSTKALYDFWLSHHPKNSIWETLRGNPYQFELASMASIGRLHMLFEGHPGMGKTYWSVALQEIQLPQANQNWKDIARIRMGTQSVTRQEDLLLRPFISPHHSSSSPSIIGNQNPGLISKAHGGILFLDELPEFRRDVLEALREPLESKQMTLGRANGSKQFPADVQVVATMNPCPCGRKESTKRCFCSASRADAYQARVSQPLRDRFHHHVWWKHSNETPESPWTLQKLKRRLLDVHDQPVCLNGLQLPSYESPRRLKLRLESFTAWCRLRSVSQASQTDWNAYEQFISFFDDRYSLPATQPTKQKAFS